MPVGMQIDWADFQRQKRRVVAAIRQLENPQPRDVLGRWIRPAVEPSMQDFARWLNDYWGTVTTGEKRYIVEAINLRPTERFDYDSLIYSYSHEGRLPSQEEAVDAGFYGGEWHPTQPWDWRGVDIPPHLIPQPSHFVPEERLRDWMEEKGIPEEAFWPIERALMKRGWFTRHPGRKADPWVAENMDAYRDSMGDEVIFERVHVDEDVIRGFYGWVHAVCRAAGSAWPG